MTKLFATGCTGYIGGDALYAIAHAHPEYDITCLVRNSDKGAVIAAEYPKIRLVYGDLDSSELLEEEARKADVVCHFANADHEGAAIALIKGLVSHPSSGPVYYIHTSGTGILTFGDVERQTFGEASEKIYNDYENVSEVTSLPDAASHRNVDKIVLKAAAEHGEEVKIAIVCPPTIYGQGRGPGNKRSLQVPELCRATIEKGHGIQVGAGKAYWTEVHIHDLSDLYLKLVEAAVAGGGPATWGVEGYYFAENGEFAWGDVAKWVAHAAYKQGYIQGDKVERYEFEAANNVSDMGGRLWGANSRPRAVRARKLLGWTPKGKSLKDEVPETVSVEAKKMGKGHAAVAAGDA
ncbi:hypothetical protein LTR50_007807 [Elasticomyces elasticus]|nr:hypothetical protein LTR50_007807 [Elasticomyces elasticus]